MKEFVDLLISWGPFGVLLLAVVDSAGVPLPGGVDALVTLIAAEGPHRAMLTAALAVAGSCVGCMFMFWVARKGGQRYLDKHASSPRAMRFRRWFDQYGLLTVFIPVLVPIPLPVKVFVLCAGALGTRPLSFLGVVLAARIPRYFGLAWLGMQLGEQSLDSWLKAHVWQLTGFAAALFLTLYLLVKLRANQKPPQTLIR